MPKASTYPARTLANILGVDGSGNVGLAAVSLSANGLTFSSAIGTTQQQTIQINGAYSGANLFNRAIQDASTFTSTTTGGYASYDANSTMNGATAYNHYFGFECRNIYAGTGGLTTAASFISNGFQFNGSGTIAAFRHFDLTDASVSGPTLTENSGFYCPDINAGTNNYGLNLNVASGTNKYNVYAPGTAVSYFNGQVEFHAGQKRSAGTINVTAASQRINFAANTNLYLSGTGTISTIASLDDAGTTYEPFFLKGSVITLNAGASGTEFLRVNSNGVFTNQATAILHSEVTITGGGTAQAPTLTAGPVAGNPTKWLPYDDNGTTRYIPSW